MGFRRNDKVALEGSELAGTVVNDNRSLGNGKVCVEWHNGATESGHREWVDPEELTRR